MKPETKSNSTMSSANNTGPGQGGKKASTGSPISLGLNEHSKIEGGIAGKLRGNTGEGAQKPKSEKKSVSSDRGTFTDMC